MHTLYCENPFFQEATHSTISLFVLLCYVTGPYVNLLACKALALHYVRALHAIVMQSKKQHRAIKGGYVTLQENCC